LRTLPNVCYWRFSFSGPHLNYPVWKSSRSPADENTATSPLCTPSGTISKEAESKYDRTSSAPNLYSKISGSPGLGESQVNKVIEPDKLQLDAIFGASDEELSEISDLEVAGRRVQSIEARKVKRVKTKRAASPFPDAETEMEKMRPVGTMNGVESPGVLQVTHEADGRQSKDVMFATNKLVPRSFHHQSYHVSPDKSTSDARPHPKSRRHVRKNIIASIESVTDDMRLATSTSSMFRMPPLRGGVGGGNSESRIEATGTPPIPDAGTAASPNIYHTQEVFGIAPLVSRKSRCQ
jgi:hypothetical protein